MKLFGWTFERKADQTLDQILQRLEAAVATVSGVVVTPDTCMESPTVQSIVNAISMRMATLPVHVYQTGLSDGRATKERLPSHPVARLLGNPNGWQTSTAYWLDAVSTVVRYGQFVAVKGRGVTGPIRKLWPVIPSSVQWKQDDDFDVLARVSSAGGKQRDYTLGELHHVRGAARDFLNADSPVTLAREAIALEIAAQRFGAAFFGNGAMPGLIFSYMQGNMGHQSKEQRDQFLRSFHDAYGKTGRFKAMVLPAGMDKPEQLAIENDKAQFLETRKLQRSVIAGAFGVPPHLVGDLERATFTNIEHQSAEFVEKVVLPYCRMFETSMERDLLTADDRSAGIVIRFNLDAALRADFKSRQEGMKIQREMGVLSPNEWRERENMNPRDGGDDYWDQGPSGQGQGAPSEGAQ